MGGLVLLGIGALLVASVAAGDEKKPGKLNPDPEPKPVPPGPQPVAAQCVPTSPGDGPANGKEAAVRAWQGCLVAAGCLAPDQIDGKHGPMTTGASELYISSGGKCAAPFKLPTGGGGGGATKNTSYRLVALTASGGTPKYEQLGSTDIANPVKKSDEDVVLMAFKGQADIHFGQIDKPGEAFVFKKDGKGEKQIWTRTYGPKGEPDVELNA